uniref:Uncharacterized protein n=1 Tax=Candidatus Methanogaster sp. ANME-2c ERB4 TaxID=2759911 RepID=A0A7G9YG19_9EURY|nr:hypothetical protein CLAIAILK_00014 [Methanosarcinales archaeon ANME-2c ERB4]
MPVAIMNERLADTIELFSEIAGFLDSVGLA